MTSLLHYALVLHGETPAGRAAVQAARQRGFKVVIVRHGLNSTSSDDGLTFDLKTSDLQDVESLANNLDKLDIVIDTLITCPRSVFSKTIQNLTQSFEETTLSVWDETIEDNLKAAMVFCRVFGRRMRIRRQGRIVQLISNVILDPHHPNHFSPLHPSAAYVSAMAGLQALTRHLAAQYRDCGILINNLVYGPLQESEPEQPMRSYIHRVPLGHVMTVDDLAHALDLFLDSNNNYMTGQSVIADGGVTIW